MNLCVSLAEKNLSGFQRILDTVQFAEIRIDPSELSDADTAALFTSHRKLIATCRPCARLNETERQQILITAIQSGANYVDIELESPPEFKRSLIECAAQHNCDVIISHHDYAKTPPTPELHAIIDTCFTEGATIAKIACQCQSPADAARILSLYADTRPLIAIGMGDFGRITRLASLYLGAPFTYVSLGDKQTAPGQLSLSKIEHIIRIFNV